MDLRLPSRMTSVFGDVAFMMVVSLGTLGSGLALLLWGQWLAGSLFLALGLALTVMSRWRTLVALGADGVCIRWLGMVRFIPYSEFASMTPHTKDTAWEIPEGRRTKATGVLLQRLDHQTTFLVCSAEESRDLSAHVNERIAAQRQSATVPEVPALWQGDRSMSEWLKSLGGLLETHEYRIHGTTAEALWAIVENPKSEGVDRAAAALALRSHLGEQARPRLRVAADACASPKLRVALDSIEHEDIGEAGASVRRLAERRTAGATRM